MRNLKTIGIGCCLFGFGVADRAFATDGFYLTGSNARSGGMGGVGIALPQGPEAASLNPAGASFVESGFEVGGQAFILNDTFKNLFFPGNNVEGHQYQPVPDFGVNYHLNDRVTLALTSFGGGLGQQYTAPFIPGAGYQKERANFIDLGIAPTVSVKLLDNLSVGASLALTNELFRAKGVIVPLPSGAPTELPNHGFSYGFGVGGRFGILWKPIPALSLGATYITKVSVSKLAGYDRDLFAGAGGSIDTPEQWGLGVSYKVTPRLVVALDYVRTNWSGVKAFSPQQGFGWHDHGIYKFGAAYDVNPGLTVRAGAALSPRHFDSDYVLANVNAPGTSSQSVTVGLTKKLDEKNELTFSGDYELNGKVIGTGPSAGTSISSHYGTVGASFSHRF